MRRIAIVFGTLFGSGCAPRAPGTFGTLFALLVVAFVPDPHYGVVTGALAVLSTLLGPACARTMMRDEHDDPQSFVLDEGAGFWIAAWRPTHPGVLGLVLAFIFFRLLDITKPGPIRRIESLSGGRGVVYDDVLAGIGAWALSFGIERMIHRFF